MKQSQLINFCFIYFIAYAQCRDICNNLVLTSRLTMKTPEKYMYLLVKSVIANNVADCASVSALTWNCASFFFQENTNKCLLYRSRISALTLDPEFGWVGYEFQGRPLPEAKLATHTGSNVRIFHHQILQTYSACETNGYTFNSDAHMCYKVHQAPTTWSDAVAVCDEEGGIMVKLNTTAKKRVLEGSLTEEHDKYFLGAKVVGGEWRWQSDDTVVTGLAVTGSDDCMRMKLESDNHVEYDDDDCDDENSFFCERPV